MSGRCEDIALLTGYGSNPDTRHLSMTGDLGPIFRGLSLGCRYPAGRRVAGLAFKILRGVYPAVLDERPDPNSKLYQFLQGKILKARLILAFFAAAGTGYHYTMVLDSDTVCPAKSIRQIVGNCRAFGQPAARLIRLIAFDVMIVIGKWRTGWLSMLYTCLTSKQGTLVQPLQAFSSQLRGYLTTR